MADFKIGVFHYRSKRLNAFDQLAIAKRLAPLITSGLIDLVPFFKYLSERMKASEIQSVFDIPITEAMVATHPVAKAFKEMGDDDLHFIVSRCMDVCERRKDAEGWQKIWNPAASIAQFQDLNDSAMDMLLITWNVLREDVVRFFPLLVSHLSGAVEAS